MCLLCAPRVSIEDCPTLAFQVWGESISETTDAANSTATAYTINAGDSFEGSLTIGDRDWVRIDLQGGEAYTISLSGAPGGGGTLPDTYLRIYDTNGTLITSDDDGGTGYDSALNYTATNAGTFYIEAGSFGDNGAGTYTMTVAAASSPSPVGVGTISEMADFLTNEFWGGRQYAFDTSGSNILNVDLTGLTADGAQIARWALDAWEMVADLQFVEVSSGANITFDDNASGAFAGADSINSSGFVTSASVNVSTNWISSYGTDIDTYSFQTYVHEIGHALGLGHQGDYNGSATYGVDNNFENDSWQMSVMSYFAQNENTSINASRGYTTTAMMVDVMAIQNLYGASTQTAGDTNWGVDSFGNYLDDVFDSLAGGTGGGNIAGNSVVFTIYDHSGRDTLTLDFLSDDSIIDLGGGSFSDIGGLIGNLAIASGTTVEDLVLGAGSDQVTGNFKGNEILAGGGDDDVSSLGGFDVLFGEAGNDTLSGGDDDDKLYGGNGNDTLYGGNHDDRLFGGNGSDVLHGDAGDDRISGWSSFDEIYGGAGNDIISGDGKSDTIYGGDGDDLIYGDGDASRPDQFQGSDIAYGGAGNDTIIGGAGADTLYGDADADIITGGDGWNELYGGDGNDELFGGVDTDRLSGGAGFDEMTGGGARDVFLFHAGTGTDHVLDFSFAENDRLNFDDALWASSGTLNRSEVVDQFASVNGSGDTVFQFAGGDQIVLIGIDDLSDLNNQITIF